MIDAVHVVGERFSDPDSEWVIVVGFLVAARGLGFVPRGRLLPGTVGLKHPLGSVEQLHGLKRHLDDMLVAVVESAEGQNDVQEEDVHRLSEGDFCVTDPGASMSRARMAKLWDNYGERAENSVTHSFQKL
jgi:hypothetical protein